MKKLIGGLLVVLSSLFFSSLALADIAFVLEGKGNTTDAVDAFNKALASNFWTVDNNAKTSVSSAGDLEGYQAIMYAEKKNDGKVGVRVVVKLKKPDILLALVRSSVELQFAKKIQGSMVQNGYYELPASPSN